MYCLMYITTTEKIDPIMPTESVTEKANKDHPEMRHTHQHVQTRDLS